MQLYCFGTGKNAVLDTLLVFKGALSKISHNLLRLSLCLLNTWS